MRTSFFSKRIALGALAASAALATLALLPTTPARAATTINASLSMPPNNLGLVGWWTFDGGNISGTTVTDTSGTGNNGTLVNGPIPVVGKLGQAFYFNGTNQYVNSGDPTNGSLDFGAGQSFSLSFWFKTNDDATNQSWPGFISKEDSSVSPRTGYNCFLSSSQGTYNKLGCETWVSGTQDGVTSSMTVNDNMWHHAVFVRDISGSTMKLYVDGVLNSSSALSSTGSTANSVNLVLALRNASPNVASLFLQTNLDDVRIFNRALSASEVSQMYNAGSGSHINVSLNPPNLANGLVGWWTFDGAQMVSNVADTSGQGNNGNLVSYTSTTTTPGPVGQALSFNGNNQYVNLGTNSTAFNFSANLSGAAWIKTATDGKIFVSYQNNNPLFYMQVGATTAGGTANKFVVYLRTDNGTVVVLSSNKSVTDNIWHHVVFTRDASAQIVNLYIDGVLDSQFGYTDTGPISTSAGGHSISLAGTTYSFNGSVDDVRVYNRALSAQEVKQLYNLSRTTLKAP
ncbi:MAG: LamG domain-containing protein [Minisyncoccota bacterium]